MSNYRLKRPADLNPPRPRPIPDAIRILGVVN
jgi:hypothetical protein